mmetsp:Transcript_10958/g.22607  ORF Transcript_10958/g.22607 Transcript_10958/m.22607 type:complete len:94 (+) Transcript_10958:69-350(+)
MARWEWEAAIRARHLGSRMQRQARATLLGLEEGGSEGSVREEPGTAAVQVQDSNQVTHMLVEGRRKWQQLGPSCHPVRLDGLEERRVQGRAKA